ncbi:muconolactone Delta-isomerase family protein [Pseudomonas putida]
MTNALIERIDAIIVDLPTIRPHKLAMHTMQQQTLVVLRLRLWRIAGHYANYSVFDVPSVEALHDTLMQLPLFPYMDIEVDGLCRHPSSIHSDDR